MSGVVHSRLWIGKRQRAAAVQTVGDFEIGRIENTLGRTQRQFPRRQ